MRSACSARGTPKFRSGSARARRMVKRGLSASNGFWNTSCARARNGRSAAAAQLGDVAAVEMNLAGARVFQAQQHAGGGGLAAAGFADDPERLAGGDGKADVVHGMHRRGRDRGTSCAGRRPRATRSCASAQVAGSAARRAEGGGFLGAPAGGEVIVGVQPERRQVRSGSASRRTGSARRSGSPVGGSSKEGGAPSIGTSAADRHARRGRRG